MTVQLRVALAVVLLLGAVAIGMGGYAAGRASRPAAVTTRSVVATVSADADSEDASDSADSEDTSTASTADFPALNKRYVAKVAGIGLFDADAAIEKRFGRGFFVSDEDHGGGRYFVDPARTVTLHLGIGTDSAIDDIELSSGVTLPAGMKLGDDPRVYSAALPSDPAVSKGIRLGMSAQVLLKTLGKPVRDERSGVARTIVYDDETGDSNYYAQFSFVGDQLRHISISDGD